MSPEQKYTMEQLLEELESPDEPRRAWAIHQLGLLDESRPEAILALEKIAATEQDSILQREALAALDSRAHRQLRRCRKPRALSARKVILHEIRSWENEGLLDAPLIQLLMGRYAVAETRAKPAVGKEPTAPVEQRSLGQVLLSETTIKVALFLGAFFVLAASLILAALVEVARLPILLVTTIAFLVAAGVLFRRIRLSSFIMFIVGTLLIAIDGGVLLDQLGIEYPTVLLLWSAITALLGVAFAAGMLLYDSRLLSLLSYGFLVGSVVLLAAAQTFELHEIYLLSVLLVMAGLISARTLDRIRRRRLFFSVFLAAHFLLGLTLATSVVTLIIQSAFGSPPEGLHWLSVAGLYSIAGLAYTYSTRLLTRVMPDRYQFVINLSRVLSVAAIMPVPLFLAATFEPTDFQLMFIAWVWGLAMAITSGIVEERLAAIAGVYPTVLMIAAALLFAIASGHTWWTGNVAVIGFLSASAVVFYLMNARHVRWPIWSAALLALYLAYTAAFDLTGLASLNIFPGYAQLLPITGLFIIGVMFMLRDTANRARWIPPLALSGLGALLSFSYTLNSDLPIETAIISLYYAALFAIFTWQTRYDVVTFGSTAAIAASLHFFLLEYDIASTIWPYVSLGALYYLLSSGLAWRGWITRSKISDFLRWSGLVLSFVISWLILDNIDFLSAAAVIAAALMFTYETWHRHNLWLGYPAAILYFAGYTTLMAEFEITEPQFYSMFAALLGLTMHYLMLKINNRAPALATGAVAQLILLTTTYVQMVTTDELRFFVFLFCQALVLLAYGVFLRSLSFVAGPVFFVVLAVITVTISVLSGLPVALMIGFVGLLLLLLGTTGLWFRRRLVSTAGSISSQLVGWNW